MECVNISSNDILQLGVLLLSYKEVLHDSGKKKTFKTNSPHIIRKSNQTKIMQVFYHRKKSCCLHGTMCLFLIMIYPPNVILIKKERKEKKITQSL